MVGMAAHVRVARAACLGTRAPFQSASERFGLKFGALLSHWASESRAQFGQGACSLRTPEAAISALSGVQWQA